MCSITLVLKQEQIIKQGNALKILGIAGSLRQKSYNRALLKSAVKLLPDGSSINLFDLTDIPLYNEDLTQKDLPLNVTRMRDALADAQALLISSPEYNYSIPGLLKNALDWATTNTLGNLLANKHVGIMGASPGSWGTTRAQLHLRQVLHAANAVVVARPEIFVRKAGEVFDEKGVLTDEKTSALLSQLLRNLITTASVENSKVRLIH